MGQVRAILWKHLETLRQGVPCPAEDPNQLLPAPDFSQALAHEGDLRGLGRDYVRLWSRTFKTLTRHLRGRPDRALAIFAEEVYPFLRGRRLAARVEHGKPARVVLDDDLPVEYVAGLVEGVIQLTGAQADVQVFGQTLEVGIHLNLRDQWARSISQAASLRLPLLATSGMAAAVGLAFAHAAPWIWLAVLLGTVAAQSGANAMHDLVRPRPRHALGPVVLPISWLWFQTVGSFLVAGGCLIWLALMQPTIIAFAAAGLVLGGAYSQLRELGWGPAIATITHGPLIVLGAMHAAGGPLTPLALAWSLPTGLFAATMLYVDDLADRPLDAASGNRTLVVRLERGQFMGYLALLGAACGVLVGLGATRGAWLLPLVILMVAVYTAAQVRTHLDNPRGLAGPRALGFATYSLAAAHMILEIP